MIFVHYLKNRQFLVSKNERDGDFDLFEKIGDRLDRIGKAPSPEEGQSFIEVLIKNEEPAKQYWCFDMSSDSVLYGPIYMSESNAASELNCYPSFLEMKKALIAQIEQRISDLGVALEMAKDLPIESSKGGRFRLRLI